MKIPPIRKRGDTLSYIVSVFKEQKDRVIGDVLKKLPGIEVLNNGRILYQGKPILKYYIEGLDLLGGKYNLANNNLPANAVSKVQILENHQPIKLLDSLVFTDKASLNIKLKKKITSTGSAKTGVGYKPLLWDVNITPMLFTKNQQIISSYQTNNTGNNISNELKTLTVEDILNQFDSNSNKSDWVGIQQLTTPPFAENRWLDNNTHLVTINYLIRLKNNNELKTNISYLNDFQKQNGNTQTTIFTPTDTINIFEITKNKLFYNTLQSKLTFIKNTKKNYFKNDLNINSYWDSQIGLINTVDSEISQKVNNPLTAVTNKLNWIKPIGKKLTKINSVVTYTKLPQKLRVSPGPYKNLLNNSNSFDNVTQNINLSNFYTNTTISFTRAYKKLIFTPKIGFKMHNQYLNSTLSLLNGKKKNTLFGDFQNNLNFNTNSLNASLNTQLKHKSWRFELMMPFNLQSFNIFDNSLAKKQKLNRFTLEPQFLLTGDVNAFWKATLSVDLKNKFGDIDQLYYGFILNNYRNIQKYDSKISEEFQKNYRIGFSYRNPIQSFFTYFSYTFNTAKNNLIISNVFSDEGASILETVERYNYSSNHNINLRSSKYFSRLKTTITLMSNYVLTNRQIFLNNLITDVKTKNQQLEGKINIEPVKWLSLALKSKYSFFKTILHNQSLDGVIIQKHVLNLDFYPSSNQYIGFGTELYKNNLTQLNQENYFLNLNYRYSFVKSKIDLDFNWQNILNTKLFTTAYTNSFSYLQSNYILRPSQLIMSVKFGF